MYRLKILKKLNKEVGVTIKKYFKCHPTWRLWSKTKFQIIVKKNKKNKKWCQKVMTSVHKIKLNENNCMKCYGRACP